MRGQVQEIRVNLCILCFGLNFALQIKSAVVPCYESFLFLIRSHPGVYIFLFYD